MLSKTTGMNPVVTVGDVPNRAALERAADKMSADG